MLDTKLINADVLTMEPDRPAARTIGIWRGRIFGLDEQVEDLPAAEVHDLEGACVLPGFVDPHVHLAWTGLAARSPSIAGCSRVEDALAVIQQAALDRSEGEWVDVAGYDQRALGRHLRAAELDAVSAGRKVFVVHDSGHACVVNTAVLNLLPASVSHEDGVLAESGMAAVRAARQPYPLTELVDAIEHALRTCRAQGITTCAEAGIGAGLISHSPVELAAYQLAAEQDRLPARVQLMVAADALHPVHAHPGDGIASAMDLGLRTGFGGDLLSIGALKVFTDGGMMPRTAALTESYTGLEHAGQLYADPRRITEAVTAGHVAGWQLAIHAIGDRAVDVALDALERAWRARPRSHARHRIEHAGLVRPDQLERFARLDVTAVVQPNFLYYLGDDYAAIMGEHRAPWLYRGQAFLERGIAFAASSDRPVTDGAPLRAIQFMTQRLSSSGMPIGPDERIGVQEALHAYTAGAARACHREHDVGTIAPGKHADLAILAQDPRAVATDRIADIEILDTWLAGTPT